MRSVIETAEAVRRGEVKAVEVLDQALAAVSARDGELNAFCFTDPDGARAAAESVDAAVAAGRDPGPLAGVPFGVKDLEDCRGMPTSYGSLLYRGRPPAGADSIHVARLRAAGGVPLGKTNVPEFGAVPFTRSRAWGTARNPWNPAHTPGGSSGGSGAAVAAAMVPLCTADDGGGSTRIPASFCGLVGLKASFGRIPNAHQHPSQTAVPGALVTTVADAARHLDVAAGPDDRDRTSLPTSSGVTYERAIEELDLGGLRVGWSPDLGFAAVDPEVLAVSEQAARQLIEAAGLRPVEAGIHLTDPIRVWMAAGAPDLWWDIERDMWPARADDFVPSVRRTLELTESYALSRFTWGQRRRRVLEEETAALFERFDVLLTPATAVAAFDAEGHMPTEIAGRPAPPGMAVPFTMPANLCWNPAASVPAGVTAGGLPVGLQIMGRRHADDVVLRLARILEQVRPWPRVAPGAPRPRQENS